MKDKEHEASNYVYDRLSIDNECYHCLIAEEMFLAGISFAEQWISVNDELPEKKRENGMSELVIAKINSTNDDEPYVLTCYDYNSQTWNYKIYDVTHWRPINRK